MKKLGSLNPEERKEFGMHANEVRQQIEKAIGDLREDFSEKALAKQS
jgi:phenylalanyl-tRNA synthetase alpha subunit